MKYVNKINAIIKREKEMMKKNLKDNNVVRAMAIGIAAMMAMAEPMTVLAEEPANNDTNTNNQEQGNTAEATAVDAAQKAAGEANDAIDAAKVPTAVVKSDVAENVEAGELGTYEVGDGQDYDPAQDIIDTAAGMEMATEDKQAELASADTYIESAVVQLGVAGANAELAGTEVSKADTATDAATGVAEDLEKIVEDTNTAINEQMGDIENATTIAGANAAYDEMEDTIAQAEADFNAKVAEYDTAKAAYDEAVAKVAEYEEAYKKALWAADDNAYQAEVALADAKANAENLALQLEAAKNQIEESAKEALIVAKAEETAEEDGGLNWRNEDALFSAIMKNYYLPEVLDIEDENATVTRIQGIDDNEYNYFEVKYIENGEEKIAYYNYKMDGESQDKIVIFEKREVEVNGDPNLTPDRYVDAEGNVIDIAAGLANGSVLDVDGKYVEKNDMTGSETLVENSTITDTSTSDVTINEATKTETYALDENGDLVKTVTADVTTVTYTGKTFTSEESYATEAERDAAAADKEAELEETTGKDATVENTEDTTYTYVATGTYIPTFSTTINVENKEVERKYRDWDITDKGVKTEEEAVAAVEKECLDNDDYYVIESSNTLEVTGASAKGFLDDADYLVSGNVSVTYAKVEKESITVDTFGALFNDIIASIFGGTSSNEQLSAAVKAIVEESGGIFISANWIDGNYDKADVRYVKGYKLTSEEKASEEEAKAAVDAIASAGAQGMGASGVINNSKKVETKEHTTYSYKVNYLEGSESTETKAIATESYADAEVLKGEIIQNLNYINGNIKLDQNNEAYREFVDSAKALSDKYQRLLSEAEATDEAVKEAQDKVNELRDAIWELEGKALSEKEVQTLNDLKTQLAGAEAAKVAAEEDLEALQDKLEEAAEVLEEVVEALTPDPDDDDDEDDDVTVITEEVVPLAATPTAPVVNVVTAPVQEVVTPVAGTPVEEAPTTVIEEQQAPLADTVIAEETVEEKKEEIVTIEDEQAALASGVEKESMSWWWLLIVLLLGATGYEMYRRHQAKKAEAEDAE